MSAIHRSHQLVCRVNLSSGSAASGSPSASRTKLVARLIVTSVSARRWAYSSMERVASQISTGDERYSLFHCVGGRVVALYWVHRQGVQQATQASRRFALEIVRGSGSLDLTRWRDGSCDVANCLPCKQARTPASFGHRNHRHIVTVRLTTARLTFCEIG